jgi:UDP-3-O-[3-hydroxymyristoyl] N-acetylglucosamine deacetylase
VDSTGQRVVFDMSTGSYSRDIARARTFGFTKDVEMMRANGLALGRRAGQRHRHGRLQGAQRGGLRYDDEFVKHKILDAMGDLYLVGKPLLAATARFARATHSTTSCCVSCSIRTDAWERGDL